MSEVLGAICQQQCHIALEMPVTESACFDVQFVPKRSCKGTISSMAVSFTNTMVASLCAPKMPQLMGSHPIFPPAPFQSWKTCTGWAGVRLEVYSSIRYGIQWHQGVFTFESAEHLFSFILSSLCISLSCPSPWCLSTAVYLTYHCSYGLSSGWAMSVPSHYPLIIHSGSVWIFSLLIPSAATVFSMHNREPSYLSPLLWLQASCGQWDQQEP